MSPHKRSIQEMLLQNALRGTHWNEAARAPRGKVPVSPTSSPCSFFDCDPSADGNATSSNANLAHLLALVQ